MLILYLLILFIPFQSNPLLGMNLFGTFTLIKLVGLISLLYALVYHISGRGQKLFESKISKLFCSFTLISLASFLVFYDLNIPHAKHLSHISFFAFFIVALTFIDSKEKLRKCLWVCIFAMFLGSYTVIKWCMVTGFRVGGGFGDANIFAANAVLMLPLAYYLFLSEKRFMYKMTLLGMLVLIMGGFFVAQSRGATAGFLVSLLVMCWGSAKKIKAFLGVILLIIVLIPFVPESFWSRLGVSGYEQQYGAKVSTEAHIQRWVAGLNMIKEHPLLGVGLDNCYFTMSRYNPELEGLRGAQAHNGYIEIAAELGVPGFCVFGSMLCCTFFALRRIKKIAIINSDQMLVNFTKGLEAGLVGFLVCCFFVNVQYQKLFWLVIFLVIIIEKIVSKKYSSSPTLKLYSPPMAIRDKEFIM